VIVAYLNEDDALHDRSLKLDLSEAVLNELVLAEVANVLQKRVKDRDKLSKVLIELVENMPLVLATLEDLRAALKIFLDNYPSVSYTDSVLIAQSKNSKAEILTFDENLRKAA
jgi:predicted nucleic acid-binding protein